MNRKNELIEIIENNSGFNRPQLDNNSIPIVLLFLKFTDKTNMRQIDIDFIYGFVMKVINGIVVTKVKGNRFPEGYNNVDLVVEFVSTKKRPAEYTDESSILFALLFELLGYFNVQENYIDFKNFLDNKVSLQIPYPNTKEYDIEKIMFNKTLNEEIYVDVLDKLPEDFNEYKNQQSKRNPCKSISYKSDKYGFKFLRTLSHIHYSNDIFPHEWVPIVINGQ